MPWGVAAAAVGAAGSYAASEQSAKAAGGDKATRRGRKKAMEMATQIADRPYEGYTGSRVSGLSANEIKARDLAGTQGTSIQSDLDNSRESLRKSQLEFNGENLNKYMNPYLDTAYKQQNDAYDRERAGLLNSKAGAWGGDRAAFDKSELDRTHRESLGNISREAYDAASQNFFKDADRNARAAEAWRATGGDTANMNRQQIQDLMATGQMDRLINQANLDFDYNQFVEQRDWDVTNLDPLLRALGGSAAAPGADHGASIAAALGGAASAAGMYFAASGSKTPTPAPTGGTNYSNPLASSGEAGFVGPTRT